MVVGPVRSGSQTREHVAPRSPAAIDRRDRTALRATIRSGLPSSGWSVSRALPHESQEGSIISPTPSNRTHLSIRLIAAAVLPFLLLAFVILYLSPDSSGDRFAWGIQPHMTALYIGAGYLGGGFLLFWVAMGQPWHRVQHGFLPITAFTWSMLAATLLHWDRFDLDHFPFQLWLVLYVVTPLLIPSVWLWNRREDPGTPEVGDKRVPLVARAGMLAAGTAFGVLSMIGFLSPALLTRLWVWQLSPLTARVIAGWLALLAVGGLVIGRESRWSACRIGLGAISLWHLLVVVGALWNVEDFGDAGLFNWYLVLIGLGLAGSMGLFVVMERR